MKSKKPNEANAQEKIIAGSPVADMVTRAGVTSVAVSGALAMPEILINNIQSGKTAPSISALRAAYLAVAIKGAQQGLVKSGLLSNGRRYAEDVTHPSEMGATARTRFKELVKTNIALPGALAATETAALSYLSNAKLARSIGQIPALTTSYNVFKFSALGFLPRFSKNFGNAAACMMIAPIRYSLSTQLGDTIYADIASVGIAGGISTVFTPFDVVTKTQVRFAVEGFAQTQKFESKSILSIAGGVVEKHGMRGLFRGAPLSFAMNTIALGIIHFVGKGLDIVAEHTQPEKLSAGGYTLFGSSPTKAPAKPDTTKAHDPASASEGLDEEASNPRI